MVQSLAASTTPGRGDKNRDGGSPPSHASVMAALAENIPGDLIAFHTGLFALLNATEHGARFEVRMAVLAVGVACAIVYYAMARMAEAQGVTFASAFTGRPAIGLLLLMVTFLIWAMLVMSGKQEADTNVLVLIAGFVWTFLLALIRKGLRL